jgi:hypothetical protein
LGEYGLHYLFVGKIVVLAIGRTELEVWHLDFGGKDMRASTDLVTHYLSNKINKLNKRFLLKVIIN